ncbi:MAG: DNA-deoxyinosine glycosylase [Campylobacteraceae bacterium]|jgi:hypoxanthine-DNA glycosylase|nr:DNA-deoxyinosine glycosylase [Campylobacteraceae bacterium]
MKTKIDTNRAGGVILTHPWECVFDENAKILILGSFPSPKSREEGFYYGHPQNIFWQTLARVVGVDEPKSDRSSKTDFLLQNRIALWDVLHSCRISGADDNTITNPVPNDFSDILRPLKIRAVFTTGKKATELFQKLCAAKTGFDAIYLPSTSPANRAQQKSEKFLARWLKIREFL